MDKMREEFESWYLKQVYDDNVESIELWDAWKASRAALRVEIPQGDCDAQDAYIRRLEFSLDEAGIKYTE